MFSSTRMPSWSLARSLGRAPQILLYLSQSGRILGDRDGHELELHIPARAGGSVLSIQGMERRTEE